MNISRFRDKQQQKNVARRIRELTGSDVVVLNDHLYMKNLCKSIEEKRQVYTRTFTSDTNKLLTMIYLERLAKEVRPSGS